MNDKIKHFGAFFVLGGILCYVTNSPRWLRRFGTIGLIGMGYAALDEMTQHFVPGRYPDPMDFVADSIGLWSAVGIYVIGKLCFARTPSASA
ncbi:MAG: VanZ family protein [Rubripirellula sp.]